MIYGPISLVEGIRIAVQQLVEKNSIDNVTWVKFATIVFRRGNQIRIQYDDGVYTTLSIMSPRIIGTLCPETPRIISVIPEIDAMPYIEVYNSLADDRKITEVSEVFDGIVFDSISIFSPQIENSDIIVYPKTLRFEVGNIVQARFQLQEFEVERTDETKYARILKKTMEVELVGTNRIFIPTYTVQRSYVGIDLENWDKHPKIRDTKINGVQSIVALPAQVQENIRKEFFDTYFR